jgi:uncharacterized Tic20 family protein
MPMKGVRQATANYSNGRATCRSLEIAMQMQMNSYDIPPQARSMAMLAHLIGALGGFIGPFGSILGPLILWLVKKDEHPFIDDQGKEALNFQISVAIYMLVSLPVSIFTCGVLSGAVWLFGVVMGIIACTQANNGVWYRYPLCIRLVK